MRWIARRRATLSRAAVAHPPNEASHHLRTVNGMTGHLNAARTALTACVTLDTLDTLTAATQASRRRSDSTLTDFDC